MTPPRPSGHLGEMLVRVGLITEAQLDEILEDQQARRSYVPLERILVERGLLTRRQIDALLEDVKKRPKLGELLVQSGVITATQLARALERQQVLHVPLGQVLVRLGFVTDGQLGDALALQLNMRVLARMLDRANQRDR